jgi:hypothetical protein
MATHGASPDDDGLAGLFDSSPDFDVHISVAAEAGFLLGLVALFAAPFSIMHGLSITAALVAGLLAMVGVITTSRPYVAGRALAPLGLAFSTVTLILIGLRYLGLDTAFGDDLVPTLDQWLRTLNGDFPQP